MGAHSADVNDDLLKESLLELYEDAPCGYLFTAPDGTILRVNRTFLDWTGYSRAELLAARRFQDLLTVPGRLFYENQYAPLLRMQGFVSEVTFDIVRNASHGGESEPLAVLVSSVQRQDGAGHPRVIASTIFDATSRRAYERELLRARRQAEHLAAIVEASSDAILSASSDGQIRTWNSGATHLLGYESADIVGRRLQDVLPVAGSPGEWRAIETELRAGRSVHIESVAVHANGKRIDVSAGLTPHFGPLGELSAISSIIRDLRERLQQEVLAREQAARASAEQAEQRTTFLAAASNVLASSLDYATTLQSVARLAVPSLAELCVVDMAEDDGQIHRLAAAVADPAKEPLAQRLRERYPIDPAHPRGVPNVLRTGRSTLHALLSDERLRAVARDDEHLAILRALDFASTMLVPLTVRGATLGVITFVRGRAGPPYGQSDLRLAEDLAARCALAIENTRLFGAERAGRERLHTLSQRLVAIQEDERRRIGRELHDELGQSLTGVKLLLEMARRGADPPEAIGPLLGEAQALVATVMGQVRALSLNLRSTVLEDLGLLPALLWHVERYTQQTRIRVDLQHSGVDERFPTDVETAAYRIVQEALTNVARHAGVDRVSVRLWRADGQLCLEVADTGRGFRPQHAAAGAGSAGLAGMGERAALLGGHFEVDSAPGAGTRVVAILPVAGRTDPAAQSKADQSSDSGVDASMKSPAPGTATEPGAQQPEFGA